MAVDFSDSPLDEEFCLKIQKRIQILKSTTFGFGGGGGLKNSIWPKYHIEKF